MYTHVHVSRTIHILKKEQRRRQKLQTSVQFIFGFQQGPDHESHNKVDRRSHGDHGQLKVAEVHVRDVLHKVAVQQGRHGVHKRRTHQVGRRHLSRHRHDAPRRPREDGRKYGRHAEPDQSTT